MSIVSRFYKKTVVKRYDDDHIVPYFSHLDFPSLTAEPVCFETPQRIAVRGFLYAYPGAAEDRLTVFCHGLGGGHRSYMREIERLCRGGRRVLACDNVGCFASGGEDIRGLTESLNDLDACLRWVKAQERFRGAALSVVGHSWGGYAAGNILNYHPDLDAVVAISGFASLQAMLDTQKGPARLFRRGVFRLEERANPAFARSCAADALRDTDARALLIHSRDDGMVDIRCGLALVRARVDNPNVRYLEVDGKKHNPNYTADAVAYLNETFGEYGRLIRDKVLKTPEEKRAFLAGRDFRRMTEQDEDVWREIFAVLG